MRKIINIILISFLTFNLSFTSFASDDQQVKEGTPQKAGEKIIVTEKPVPVSKLEENPKESAKKEETKAENKSEPVDSKKEDSAYKDKREAPATEKAPNPEAEKIDKVVDDLVLKLDKNSNLSRALSDMQTTINTDNKAKVNTKDVSEKTEAVIKDYNQKIQTATTDKQRKKFENEAAAEINSIKENQAVSSTPNSSNPETNDDLPEKKKKILLEVKPDKEDEDEDRSQILALNPTNDKEDQDMFFLSNPIVIIALIFVIALVVAIGIVIRNKEKNENK